MTFLNLPICNSSAERSIYVIISNVTSINHFYFLSSETVPSSCSAVSTTSRMKSDGWIRLMTPSSLSTLDAVELKPEACLKATTKSASHHVTILIAANEACRGKSSLPPLMRMQRGSLKTVCISCIENRAIDDANINLFL